MDAYSFSLTLGGVGLAAMALYGAFGHHDTHTGPASLGHGHGGGSGAHALGGHGSDAAHAGHVGHGGPQHTGGGHGHHEAHDVKQLPALLSFLSPRVAFSVLVGLGASGLLLKPWLLEPFRALAAVAGGILFERAVVLPIWNLLFRFESRPALTLETAVMEVAEAVTDFDEQGQGLVAVDLDGQIVQVLGTLRAEDRQAGLKVRRGARVRIEDVDPVRSRCIVSWIQSS